MEDSIKEISLKRKFQNEENATHWGMSDMQLIKAIIKDIKEKIIKKC